MCFLTRGKSLRNAFLLFLILAVGGNSSVASAQNVTAVRSSDGERISVAADKTGDKTANFSAKKFLSRRRAKVELSIELKISFLIPNYYTFLLVAR